MKYDMQAFVRHTPCRTTGNIYRYFSKFPIYTVIPILFKLEIFKHIACNWLCEANGELRLTSRSLLLSYYVMSGVVINPVQFVDISNFWNQMKDSL